MAAKFCPECGQPVTTGARFCAECGQALPIAEPPAADSGAKAAPEPSNAVPEPHEGTPEPSEAAAVSAADPDPVHPSVTPASPPSPMVAKAGAVQSHVPAPAGTFLGEPDSGRRKIVVAGIIVLTLLLIAGAAGIVFLVARSGDGKAPAADDAAVVILEPVAWELPNPFTETVAIDEHPLEPVVDADAPAATGGDGGVAVRGSAPGLYGGTQDQSSCAAAQLVDFLAANPDKAQAWAKAQKIEVGEIADFVAGLTPVVLRRDTRVTNHGYVGGKANPYGAVLQAGSAVMVDAYGVPRVKCNCGNPLAEPAPLTSKTTYKGERWKGFRAEAVVVVRVDVKVTQIVLVSPSGDAFTRPVGTAGGADAPASSGPGTETPGSSGSSSGPAGLDAPKLAEIASILATMNGPTKPSVVTLPAARITALSTYHWNDARGAKPGKISLRAADGTVYGPFQASGREGQGGVPNAYWEAITDFVVPAGKYTVVDSQPATWSWANDTGRRGMVFVYGNVLADVDAVKGGQEEQAKQLIRQYFCPGVAEYVDSVRAEHLRGNVYRVSVHVQLDSGDWTGVYEIELIPASEPLISATTEDARGLLCGVP